MKVLVETSALVKGCVVWKDPRTGQILLQGRQHHECKELLDFLRNHADLEIGIITITVENEAKGAIHKAVRKTIRHSKFRDMKSKVRKMTLQDIVTNECLDRLEKTIEECSTRLPMNTKERDRIMSDEIEPFMKKMVENTVRYIQPPIPPFVKGASLRGELTEIMVESLPTKGPVYKGMPTPPDLKIMAEATMIYKRYGGKKTIYVASMDYHFTPNQIQLGSFLSGYKKYLENELDPTVRDEVAKKFGFIGEEAPKVTEILKANIKG